MPPVRRSRIPHSRLQALTAFTGMSRISEGVVPIRLTSLRDFQFLAKTSSSARYISSSMEPACCA